MSINLLGEQRLHEDDHGDSAQHAKETHTHEADKHGHGHEADKDGHGHEAKHESDAHKHEGHADESEHAELHLEYRFHCSQAQPPVELELHLANVGLDVDELKVTILSANAQTVRRIGAAKTVLSLR